MKIVCATNFSEASREASTAAALIARKRGDPLVLVHLLPGGFSQPLGEHIVDAAERTLALESERLAKLGVRVEGRIAPGSLAPTLRSIAKESHAALLVLGDAAEMGPLGGVIDRVVGTSEVPVLVVKSARAFVQWAEEGRPLRLVVGVDRGAASDRALAWTATMETLGAIEITVAHFYAPISELSRTGIPPPRELGEPWVELEHEVRRRVETQVRAAGFQRPPKVEIRPSGVPRFGADLIALCEETHADVVVLGTRHPSRLTWPPLQLHKVLREGAFSAAIVPADLAEHIAVPIPAAPRSILVATDFSELGNNALGVAISLLGTGGTIHLVHVAEGELPAEHANNELELLEALVPADAARRGVHVQTHVLPRGLLDIAIVQAAERFGCELICLGSHGRSGIARMLLGGVAAGVVRRADRPVLVVRPQHG